MAARSQEAELQRIDWPSRIRAELHEPINGSDSSGPAGAGGVRGGVRSEIETAITSFHSPLHISHSLCSSLPPNSGFAPLSAALR